MPIELNAEVWGGTASPTGGAKRVDKGVGLL